MSYGGGSGGCLTGARFTMEATLLHREDDYSPLPVNIDEYGQWIDSQDPLTGEIVKVWKPYDVPDNPDTPAVDPTVRTIKCLVRGIVDGGIRVAGTTERFGDTYENIDYAKMWVPSGTRITKRDRITNIKDATGRIRWRDEEYEPINQDNPIDLDDPTTYNTNLKATVFNVNGVTPLFNAFNVMTEQFVLLERAEVSEEVA